MCCAIPSATKEMEMEKQCAVIGDERASEEWKGCSREWDALRCDAMRCRLQSVECRGV